jgi:hypothetical protein
LFKEPKSVTHDKEKSLCIISISEPMAESYSDLVVKIGSLCRDYNYKVHTVNLSAPKYEYWALLRIRYFDELGTPKEIEGDF